MNSVNKLLESVWLHEWDWYKKRKRRRLKNTDFTIISSNCVGTIIYHDMGLPFLTPTINLTDTFDYITFLNNAKESPDATT